MAVTAHRSPDVARRADLARIHIGVAELGWSDADYRAALFERTGKDSASGLDAKGRGAFLSYMKECGWNGGAKPFKPVTQADKIADLWRQLDQAGALDNGSKQALLAFVGRVTKLGVDDLRFLPPRPASDVVEALKAWLKRAKAKA